MKKLIIGLAIIILILLGVIGYLIYDVGVMKSTARIVALENQMAINTNYVNQIIQFINANVKK